MITPEMIGIIGNTQGVSAKSKPNPKNVASIRKILPFFIVFAITSVCETLSFVDILTSEDNFEVLVTKSSS